MTRFPLGTTAKAVVLALLSVLTAGCAPEPPLGQSPTPAVRAHANPLSGHRLYLDPLDHGMAAQQALLAAGDRSTALELEPIAKQPTARWLTGEADDPSVAWRIMDAASKEGAVPVFVLYNIPQRDLQAGSSRGGAKDTTSYLRWSNAILEALHGGPAIVILEPDAVTAVAEGHLTGRAAADRLSAIRQTVHSFTAHHNLFVYLDAGNPGWSRPSAMLQPLEDAGVDEATGIAVNVSNFFTDDESVHYGEALSQLIGGTGIVVDTSRNGKGPPPADSLSWCNPPGRAIGRPPEIGGSNGPVDAWLWIKQPGDSDGACRPGEPEAGQWWLSYALGLTSGTPSSTTASSPKPSP